MKLTVISNYDDWEALYVDGKQVYQGHHIDWTKVLKNHFGVEVEVREVPSYEAFHRANKDNPEAADAKAAAYEDWFFPATLEPTISATPSKRFTSFAQAWGFDDRNGMFHEYRYVVVETGAGRPTDNEWQYMNLPRPMTQMDALQFATEHANADRDWANQHGRIPAWLKR